MANKKNNDSKDKVKNSDLNNLLSGLYAVANLKGAIFSYAVGVNIRNIKQTFLELQSKLVTDDEYQKFIDEKNEMLLEHATKDDQGNPTVINSTDGQTYLFKDKIKVESLAKKIEEKYTKAINNQKVNQKDFEKLMELEWDGKLKKVDLKNLPEEITGNQVNTILPMIEE